MKRQRGRGRKPGGHHNSNRHFESTGPDVKVRGSASHVYEKYMQLARDANSSGDRVMAESYLQHAEHYFRVIRAMQPMAPPPVFEQRFAYEPESDDDDAELDADAEASGDFDGGGDGGEGAEPGQSAAGYSGRDRQAERGQDRGGDRGDSDFNRRRRNRRRGPYRSNDGERGEADAGFEGRSERPERAERSERPERPERVERGERPERAERAEWGERPERGERMERSERRERAPRADSDGPQEGFGDSPKPAFLAGD